MILAIDFDDTIHDTKNVKPGYKLGVPMPGAAGALYSLHSAGHRIIIHSVWAADGSMKAAMVAWLKYFKIPFDDVTNTKPQADIYIDDKARHYEGKPDSWQKLLNELGGK